MNALAIINLNNHNLWLYSFFELVDFPAQRRGAIHCTAQCNAAVHLVLLMHFDQLAPPICYGQWPKERLGLCSECTCFPSRSRSLFSGRNIANGTTMNNEQLEAVQHKQRGEVLWSAVRGCGNIFLLRWPMAQVYRGRRLIIEVENESVRPCSRPGTGVVIPVPVPA